MVENNLSPAPQLPDWLKESLEQSVKPPICYTVTHDPGGGSTTLTIRFENGSEKRSNARSLVERTLPTYLPEHLLNILDLGAGCTLIHPRAIRIDAHNGYWRLLDGNVHHAYANLIWECRTLPFYPETIDVIFSWHMLEHFWDHERVDVLKEWTRTLRIGGRMCHVYPEYPYAGGISEISLKDHWDHKSKLTEEVVLTNIGEIENLKLLEHGWSTPEWDKFIIVEKISR